LTAEYVTDVPYVRAFENDLSPSRLRLVAALSGLGPPPAANFDYCELGSAHGDTTATLAASYPLARFVGVDLNAEHIASANKLARDGGLENVRFLLHDFEDLDRGGVPDFDYVTAHGVMSWVSPEKRRALIDFAAAKLKPEGLLHLTYNALPGWASVAPLRQLLASRAATAQGNSMARAREAVLLANALRDGGAEYFTGNPAAGAMLEKMTKLGLPYVVHEYLHAHWVPMYFAQVAGEMAEAGLHFVGQLPPFSNYRDLSIPEKLAPLFAGMTDRTAFESLKDFATNEYFRRDVYVKGRPVRDDAATRAYLDDTPFGTPLGGGPIPREVALPHRTLRFVGELWDPLLTALESGATSAAALSRASALEAFGLPRIREAMKMLALTEAIAPRQAPAEARAAPPTASYRLPSLFNRAALRDGLARGASVTLASVAAGTGVELATLDAIAVHLLTDVPPDDRVAWVRERCARPTFHLALDGRSVEGHDARCAALLGALDALVATRLPVLVELGVLERVS
jgi:hypothetical protein